jgi:hypothetical protein
MVQLRINAARISIGIVFLLNVQCAVLFLWTPESYMAGFELSGAPGKIMIQGMGLLFLMWNVPYLFALYHPIQHRTALWQAIIMQTIGWVGEILLMTSVPFGHNVLRSSGIRFIWFDGAGLLVLIVAMGLANLKPKYSKGGKKTQDFIRS